MKLINLNRKKVGIDLMGVCNAQYFPFRPDLSANFNARTDLTLVDSVAAGNATVVGREVGVFDGASSVLVGNIAPIAAANEYCIEAYFNFTSTVSMTIIRADNYLVIRAVAEKIFVWAQGMTAAFTTTLSYNDGIWHKISYKIKSGGLETLIIDGNILLNRSALGVFTRTTDNLYLGSLNGSSEFYTGKLYNVKLYTDYACLNNAYSIPLNGNSYNIISGVPSATDTITYTLDKTASPLTALNLGYVVKDGKQIINYALNTSAVVGYTEIHKGGALHNLISSFVRFPLGGFFDRSNVTIWSAAARASIYYDSLNPTDFHISELPYDTINTYFNAGYTDRLFEGLKANYGDVDFTFAILAYATQKTGADLTRVLKYIKYLYLFIGFVFAYDVNSQYIPLIF